MKKICPSNVYIEKIKDFYNFDLNIHNGIYLIRYKHSTQNNLDCGKWESDYRNIQNLCRSLKYIDVGKDSIWHGTVYSNFTQYKKTNFKQDPIGEEFKRLLEDVD